MVVVENFSENNEEMHVDFVIIGLLLFLVIFIMDLFTPLGIADGIGYIGIVLLSMVSKSKKLTINSSILSVVLILAGYFLSPKTSDSNEFNFAITNRMMAIFVVIISAVVIIKNIELKKRVIVKSNKLIIANKELESFNFIASHDLQEPLRKARNFVNVLFYKEENNISANGKYIMNRLTETVKHMQMLLDSLLIYTRLNNSVHKIERIDLNKLVDEIIIKLKENINEKGASVRFENLCKTNVVCAQFKQVICHLLHNSIKFCDSNISPEIIITSEIIHGHQLPSYLKCLKKISYCHISIADNGIGFNQQYKDRIFEVFQRLNPIETFNGAGMGLAICKKIVENHNGFITAKGELNKGAVFDIYIPN